MTDDVAVLLLIWGPAILGLGALIFGIYLLNKRREAPRSLGISVFAWLLIASFFGVGTCYALVFNTNFGG